MDEANYDVVIVGGGNAGLSAALAAAEHGASVLVVERAPAEARGGNSYFTGGLLRFPLSSMAELREFVPDITAAEAASIDLSPYSEKDFFNDMARVSEYRADADLLGVVADQANEAIGWLKGKGLRFTIAFGMGSQRSGDKFRFSPGTVLAYQGGGAGLVDGLFEAVAREPRIAVWYRARASALLEESGAVVGVRVRRTSEVGVNIRARSVVLASGGFQANPEMRAKYLGRDWDLAKVRGTGFNTGDGLAMALDLGAQPYGHWSGCHAVAWDLNAPPVGDRAVGDAFQKHSYPYGIVVNRLGRRFLDEGYDFYLYTYAKYGQEVLKQPGLVAFQIFDAKVMHLLKDDYRIRQATKVTANSLAELAGALEIDAEGFQQTVATFNSAISGPEFDPSCRDGRRAGGIDPPKSNWALAIDTPPFAGYPVTAGITFTFGGLRIDVRGGVLDMDGDPMPGLFAAGELVGGLFYHNYPGGTGLTTGTVFGRIAGNHAAARAGFGGH